MSLKIIQSRRGIALLIVLLVTALLIALIFEFAYATRISLNNAINFRDSQRAYYLARSGIYAFIKYGDQLRQYTPEGQWGVVPIVSEGDTEVKFKWEDESGKIRIPDVKNDPATQLMVKTLFDNKGIERSVYEKMTDQAPTNTIFQLTLLSGLHQYMSDEDFNKVSGCFTVSKVGLHTININTAPGDVLLSLGISSADVAQILEERQNTPYTDNAVKNNKVPGVSSDTILQMNGQQLMALPNYLKGTPDSSTNSYYKVYAYATVGDYTKQVEAVINGNSISYWREL